MLKRIAQLLGVVASCAALISCGVGSGGAYREGRKAELRKDWDTALVDYVKARNSDPANSLYILHEQNARFNAGYLHLHNGQQYLKDNKLDEAAGEFQKAVRIDPANRAAKQELDKVLVLQAQAKKAHTEALQNALKARDEAANKQSAPVKLKPLPEEPLAHFRLTADGLRVYETLAKLAGLNVVFTQDFRPSGNLNEDLSNVKIEDALKLVSLQTKTFWKAVTPNTILVIPDNPNNRRDYQEEVVKTIYLSNPLAAADRTAVTTALKQVFNLQHIMDNADSNSIIIRDTPEKVAAAEELVAKLDRARAEIMVDIDIVEADRDRIRNLGLAPATVNPSTGATTVGLQTAAVFAPTTTSGSTTTTTTSAAISALKGPGQIFNDYAVVLPGIEAQAVLNDSKTHILQSPKIRVTDGQTAKLKIGSRVPYATGSFLPSLGTSSAAGGVGLLASTQFQFQDIGVILELTPHLLGTGEVAVHAKIEISSLGASLTVGGVSEPTFGERIIEDDFRLQEGEVNLLGGLIQSTLTNAVTGVPGLGDIPLLHYLFTQTNHEVNESEVLVMVTPRVIRLPESSTVQGSAVSVGAMDGASGAGEGGPRPFEIPTPEPQPPQP